MKGYGSFWTGFNWETWWYHHGDTRPSDQPNEYKLYFLASPLIVKKTYIPFCRIVFLKQSSVVAVHGTGGLGGREHLGFSTADHCHGGGQWLRGHLCGAALAEEPADQQEPRTRIGHRRKKPTQKVVEFFLKGWEDFLLVKKLVWVEIWWLSCMGSWSIWVFWMA